MWIPYKGHVLRAREIIEENRYMVLSTCNKNREPWGSVVFYSYDSTYNFYFVSSADSLHMKNLSENPKVAIVIFDSKQQSDLSEGVQIEAKLSRAEDEADLSKIEKSALKPSVYAYYSRMFPGLNVDMNKGLQIPEAAQRSNLRFVKLVMLSAYLTRENNRIEVELRSTT